MNAAVEIKSPIKPDKRPGAGAFFVKTLNGMTYGFFATLVIGVIIQQLGNLLRISFITDPVYAMLATMMGAGIGVGMGLSLKIDGLKLVVMAAMGAVSTSFALRLGADPWIIYGAYGRPGNPLTVYCVVICGYLLMKTILRRDTSFDVILIPLTGIALSILLTFLISYPVDMLTMAVSNFVKFSAQQQPVITSILVGIVMGATITSPLSSAAVAITIGLNGTAASAALVGCTAQMIGFAVQSSAKNQAGTVLSLALGTSMLQFKNVVKKPVIWIPSLLASALLSPLAYFIFKPVFVTEASIIPSGAGMGTSGLVGPFIFLSANGYSALTWAFIFYTILAAAAFTWLLNKFFIKMGWYKPEDFILENKI